VPQYQRDRRDRQKYVLRRKTGDACIDASRLTRLRCEISTALGSPVVPEV